LRSKTIPLGIPMREYHIGGTDGWFAWLGDQQRQPGWEMKVMCDGFGNAFGRNHNETEGAELKIYSGKLGLHDGNLDVLANFESGQEIGYRGQLDADAMDAATLAPFEGTVKVLAGGANAQNFKPVGTAGYIGGTVQVRSFPHVDWVAVPRALRARRASRSCSSHHRRRHGAGLPHRRCHLHHRRGG
jgi:hypothetical protein